MAVEFAFLTPPIRRDQRISGVVNRPDKCRSAARDGPCELCLACECLFLRCRQTDPLKNLAYWGRKMASEVLMDARETHLGHLRAAEAQFRLATAVRLAVTMGQQPLDLPIEWSHGKHVVNYTEVAIAREEADFAAWNLQRSATFLMASAALEAIRATIPKPKSHTDPKVADAYQIARTIRNAFAHNPFNPIWRIDADCQTRRFGIADVIELDCTGLDGKLFDWRHYGGPLALLRLSQFVRKDILDDNRETEKIIPLPERVYYQQGDLILQKIDEIPPGAVRVPVEPLPDGSIPLGGGHVLRPVKRE